MKILQDICLHIKIVPRRLRIITSFTFWDMCTLDMRYICLQTYRNNQFDSQELPETPKIMEMTENFTKVTKYLTKFKETLINWGKSHVKKL